MAKSPYRRIPVGASRSIRIGSQEPKRLKVRYSRKVHLPHAINRLSVSLRNYPRQKPRGFSRMRLLRRFGTQNNSIFAIQGANYEILRHHEISL